MFKVSDIVLFTLIDSKLLLKSMVAALAYKYNLHNLSKFASCFKPHLS